MDFTEVPVNEGNKGKKKKNRKPKKKRQEGNGEGGEVEKEEVEEEQKMEKSESGAAFPPTFSVSEIKNKQRRHVMFMKFKQEKRKVKSKHTG